MRQLFILLCLLLSVSAASAQSDAPITLANAADLQVVAALTPPPGVGEGRIANQIVLSPSGQLAAFTTTAPSGETYPDGALMVWDIQADTSVMYHFVSDDDLAMVGFLDENRLAYILNSTTYEVIDVVSGEPLLSVPLPEGTFGVIDVTLRSELGLAAFPISNTEICLLNLEEGLCRIAYADPDVLGFYSVAISPDGALLAAGDGDGQVWIWETERMRIDQVITPPAAGSLTDLVSALAFSPDGQWIAIGSSQLSLWPLADESVSSFSPIALEGHTGNVTHVTFIDGGRGLVSMSGAIENSDVSLRVWDIDAAEQVYVYEGEVFGDLGALALRADQTAIVTLSFDEQVQIFALEA